MRSTKVILIGQGCKPIRQKVLGVIPDNLGRCAVHPDYYLNICLQCGMKFHTKRPETRTCSNAHRMAYSRSRRFDKVFQMVMQFADGVR